VTAASARCAVRHQTPSVCKPGGHRPPPQRSEEGSGWFGGGQESRASLTHSQQLDPCNWLHALQCDSLFNPTAIRAALSRTPRDTHKARTAGGGGARAGFRALVALAALLSAGASLAEPKRASPASAEPTPGISRDQALGIARAHLDAIAGEQGRGWGEVVFVGPHGKPGKGFWLVTLNPYPTDKPAPARTITSLLIEAETGAVRERGGRTQVSPEPQEAIKRQAERLGKSLGNSKPAN
jgi:hypothetical protein